MKSTPTPAFDPVLDPNSDAGTSRDAIGLGQVAGEGLNTLHGTILTLEDISVSFDGFKALNDLNLYIGVGELRCIIGPNGAGKTTLMDVITGRHGSARPWT
jgi:urea transport system ATP-binding protein